ncbi:MAG: SBBP repeat-containing protein [candidate division Zixibacteria bacterium]|nr:SBBP repeat-containing protein [candidate division Zixibacteria bacterium]
MFCKTALFLTALSLLMVSTMMATTTPNSSATIQQMNQMPLSFTKNMGQWDDRVLFRANAGAATMWFTKEGVTYQFTRRIDTRSGAVSAPGVSVGRTFLSDPGQAGMPILPGDRYEKDSVGQIILTAKFVGAKPNPEILAEGQMDYKCNYFLGNDPAKWHTDVPNYEAIMLKDIYPGIDLKYSGDGSGQAAYEFIAAPGADIARIKVAYEGAEKTSIDDDGRMVVRTKWGDMIAAIKSPTNGVLSGTGSFSQLSENTIGFEADRSTPLTRGGASRQAPGAISVGLVYSTYLGGADRDVGNGIAVDGSGNAYVTGWTQSSNFPTQNLYQPTLQGYTDVFVTKLSSTGNGLIYSTYLGGGNDEGSGIAVDGSGNAYVTGTTGSSDFPILNPYQTYQGSNDAFVTKLSSSGNNLIYSTYIGGGYDDYGEDIAVDGSGNAYVTGYTTSDDFPTCNPYQTYQWGPDAFVTKFSSSGNNLIYSTYIGGEDLDWAYSIAVDDSYNAYVTGWTYSTDFPMVNPYQTDQSGQDAFVTKLSSAGNSLVYSTYLGGEFFDGGNAIAVDRNGNAYVTGYTSSSDFPILNPYQANLRMVDVFVTKLSSSGNSLIYSTYLGGGSQDWGYGITVDASGNAYVTGSTYSSDFPTLNPYQAAGDYKEDVFVTKLSPSGSLLVYSTYLAGDGQEWGYGIAVDASGNAYVTGYTWSSNFPTQNPFQSTFQGGWDTFVTKLSWIPDYICGDANGDGSVTIADVVFLINYIFMGGAAPQPLSLGDVDCSSSINIADAVRLINYIFRDGPAPCTECE